MLIARKDLDYALPPPTQRALQVPSSAPPAPPSLSLSFLLITLRNTLMLQRHVLQIATHHLARKSDYDLHTDHCGFFIRP